MDNDPLFLSRHVNEIFRSEGLTAAIDYLDAAPIIPVCRKNELVARLLFKSERAGDAVLEFDRALHLNEKDKSPFWQERQLVYIFQKIDCLNSLGQFDQALREIDYARSLPLGQEGSLGDSFDMQEAYIFYKQGLFNKALTILDRYDFGYVVAGKRILSWAELRDLILDGMSKSG